VRWMRQLAVRLRGGSAPPTVGPKPPEVEQVSRAELEERADGWWRRLRDNDPVTVRRRLEQAFATHGFGAAVTGVHGEAVSLVLGAAPVEVMVGRWHRRPGDGALARLPRPERHLLHARMIRSAVVALTADALAVAPGLAETRCAVIQADHPERRPAVLALARLSREDVTSTEGRERLTDGVGDERTGAQSVIHLAALGSAGALAPLDRDLPMVGLLLEALERTATSQEG
jgi:hypothetical protein